MADKKSKAEDATHEDVIYAPEAATPVVAVEPNDSTKLNTLAVVSLATAVTGFGAVAGVITGHVAMSQLRRSGEKGRGLALAGLITGYVGVAGFALMGVLAVCGHSLENRNDDNRGMFSNGQIDSRQGGQFGGQQGGQFGGRGQDDQGFGMFGGQNGLNGQIQGQSGNVQIGPDQMGQGGSITLDSNGNSTITLPNGQTITLPGDGGMMRGPGSMHGQPMPLPTPAPSGAQGN